MVSLQKGAEYGGGAGVRQWGKKAKIARRGARGIVRRMTAERATDELMTVADYLEWEEGEEQRHEYVGGMVYDMAGSTLAHVAISTNVAVCLGVQLRGKPCRPFGPDLKVRIQYPTHTRFYYPDCSVVCDVRFSQAHFVDNPVVIVEVLSPSTRRTDESEKREAYLSIGSLRVYVLLEQERAGAVVWRRGDQGFAREVYEGLEAVIALPEIEARLPLAEAYEAVRFA